MADVYFVPAVPDLALNFRGGQVLSCVFSHSLVLNTMGYFQYCFPQVKKTLSVVADTMGCDAANSTEHCYLKNNIKSQAN